MPRAVASRSEKTRSAEYSGPRATTLFAQRLARIDQNVSALPGAPYPPVRDAVLTDASQLQPLVPPQFVHL